MGKVKRKRNPITLKVKDYIEKLKPGWHFRTKEMCDLLGFEGKDRHTASAVLWTEAKNGQLVKKSKKGERENLWVKPQDITEEDWPEPERELLCTKCNQNFSVTDLGNSILAIINKDARQWMEATKKFNDMADDQRDLVEQNKQLKRLIDDKDRKIVELNNKLAKGQTQVNLHELQSQFKELPEKPVGR